MTNRPSSPTSRRMTGNTPMFAVGWKNCSCGPTAQPVRYYEARVEKHPRTRAVSDWPRPWSNRGGRRMPPPGSPRPWTAPRGTRPSAST